MNMWNRLFKSAAGVKSEPSRDPAFEQYWQRHLAEKQEWFESTAKDCEHEWMFAPVIGRMESCKVYRVCVRCGAHRLVAYGYYVFRHYESGEERYTV